MSNQKQFTVAVPVYNAMPYLPATMESLFGQSFTDFELLVINDGSSDGSKDYLSTLRNPRLRIIHQENRGLTATLNRMLREVQTPWLVRMDADDIARPHRLAVLHRALERFPHAGMFYTDAQHFGHPAFISSTRSTVGTPAELAAIVRSGKLLSIIHSSVALHVERTRAIGGYRFDLHVEDLDLWWRMALHYEIVHVPEVTVDYRLNNGSICQNNLRKLTLHSLYIQYLLLSVLWQQEPIAFEKVVPTLKLLLDEKHLLYRERMWNAAIDLSNRRYLAAGIKSAVALLAAPCKLAERLIHAVRPTKRFSVGVDPERFRKISHQLWPAKSSTRLRQVTA